MCGIVAYVGKRDVFPILIKGLTRLEYRGYDSAGVAILNKNKLNVYKKKGKVNDLTNWIGKKSKSGNIGIGHTRWATHGEPNDINSHPHSSTDGSFAIIHNGIIENYSSLKTELISRGYKFKSQTDTEVVVHLIDDIRKTSGVTIEEAFKLSLNSVVGAYALVLVSKETPNQLLAARKSSPLVIGIGKDEYFLASDATPIIEYTNSVVYLNDGEIAVLNTETGLKVTDLNNEEKNPYIQTLELKLNQIEKEGWDHFMIKEIFEQPRSIYDCFRGRLNSSEGFVQLGGLKESL